ncbi:MAG: hypothetical protein FP824_06180 [Euryarchaeota archaeon]|nr:hypothetical protein [Euryarchaeota archaeon]MBU4032941.1 hypothetical protein [Candidatus Thermoplasmatota archaeon]MBU4144241.1 hypothetical protein [Candidatus Thermoplasmatota archaeon]
MNEDISVNFFLEEYRELGQFWRHTDNRNENTIKIYLTASALIISASLLLSSWSDLDNQIFLICLNVAAAILFILGVLLTRRLISTELIKQEYLFAMGLIRKYFVRKDPQIREHIFLPVTESSRDKREYEFPNDLRPFMKFLKIIHGWNSVLIAFMISSVIWIAFSMIELSILCGIAIFGVTLIFLIKNHERECVRERKKHIKRVERLYANN